MSEPGSRRGRVHDAEGAREAILNAAELVFTEHGFDGARMDAIATQAGYNKSLIFQYFGDKAALYTAVIKRADQEMSQLQEEMFAGEIITSDPDKFKTLLESIVGTLFDYLADHPRLVRMILWEQAEGWQTYKQILPQFATDDVEPVTEIFARAQKAGLLHSNVSPMLQLTMALQVCLTYLSWLPLYQLIQPEEDFSSSEALARSRAYVINFVVAAIMVDRAETHT